MPRIKTTRTVRFALWSLRIYLLILLSLIGLKFVRVFSGSKQQDVSTTGAQVVQTNQPPAATKQ
jgi:hypothetical protein